METELQKGAKTHPNSTRLFIRFWVEFACYLPAALAGAAVFLMYFGIAVLTAAQMTGGLEVLDRPFSFLFGVPMESGYSIDEGDILKLYGKVMLAYAVTISILGLFGRRRPPMRFRRAVAIWSLPGIVGLAFFIGIVGKPGGTSVFLVFSTVLSGAVAACIALNRLGDWMVRQTDPSSAILKP